MSSAARLFSKGAVWNAMQKVLFQVAAWEAEYVDGKIVFK